MALGEFDLDGLDEAMGRGGGSVRSAQPAQPAQIPGDAGPSTFLVVPTEKVVAGEKCQTRLVASTAAIAAAIDWMAFGLEAEMRTPFGALDIGGALAALGTPAPIVSLCQLTSRGLDGISDPAYGSWTHRTLQEQLAALDLVVVFQVGQRVVFPRDYDRSWVGDDPLCKSLDGKTGTGSEKLRIPFGKPCAQCALSRWEQTPEGQRRQLCGDSFALICHEAQWGPIVIQIRRTAIKPWRNAAMALRAKAAAAMTARRRNGSTPVIPLANLLVSFRLASTKVESTSGKYYVPAFSGFGPTTEERLCEICDALPLYTAIRDQLLRGAVEDVDDSSVADEGAYEGADAGQDPFGEV